jgi:hypothetical protein
MNVEYFHEIPGHGYGNIMWKPFHPMRNGRFPADHPASPRGTFDSMGDGQIGDGKMIEFRERGYWASCFPEGDGITMKVGRDQSPEQVAKDITEVFGWTVRIKRGATAETA